MLVENKSSYSVQLGNKFISHCIVANFQIGLIVNSEIEIRKCHLVLTNVMKYFAFNLAQIKL